MNAHAPSAVVVAALAVTLLALPASTATALGPTGAPFPLPDGDTAAVAGEVRDAIDRYQARPLGGGARALAAAEAAVAEVPFAPYVYISDGASSVRVAVGADGVPTGTPQVLAGEADGVVGPAGDTIAYRPVPSTGHTVVRSLSNAPLYVTHEDESTEPVAWAPAGDGFVSGVGGELVAQSTNPDYASPLGAPGGVTDAAVSPYGGEVFVREASATGSTLLVGPTPFTGLGGLTSYTDLGLSDYTPGAPAVGQAPGTGIFAPNDGATYLAFAGSVPGSGEARLFVDHQDGLPSGSYTNPVAVADTGSACDDVAAPEFSPDRRMIAYVKAVGSTGEECTAFEVHVKLIGSGDRYASGSGADTVIWTTGLGDPAPTVISWRPDNPPAHLERVDGLNRYEVSANTAYFWDADSTDTVVVAGGTAYADALTGGPLAALYGAPTILTAPDALRPVTADAIDWVLEDGGTVYVVGGPVSVSPDVLAQLTARGYDVQRIDGANRYEVAVNVATKLDDVRGSLPKVAFVSSGKAFADALVAGPAASVNDGPVLLSNGSALPTVTADYLASLGTDARLYAIGGAGAASIAADPRTEVVGGATRYDVAGNVAQRFFSGWYVLALADGRNWPDAASGGTLMANWRQPVLLTNGTTTLPAGTLTQTLQTRESIDVVLGFGGPVSIPAGALTAARSAAGDQTTYFGPDMP